MASLQIEEDIPVKTPNLDLVLFQTPEGGNDKDKWTLVTFTETVTTEETYLDILVSRYLPMWVYDRIENWDDDFRWDPESPDVQVKFYRRKALNAETGETEVVWTDLNSFTVIAAVSLKTIGTLMSSLLILTNIF